MEKMPEEITACLLEVVLMPNGEILCLGKTVGWFRELKFYLRQYQHGGGLERR